MLGDSVLAAGGAASQSCLGRTEKHTLVALLAGGIAHPPLSSRGFCSTPQSRFSWVRSARRDEEQVFLLRCQGDADWFPGQVSQCVHCCVCVHFGWVKCRAQIPSMGHHTWSYVTSLSLSYTIWAKTINATSKCVARTP